VNAINEKLLKEALGDLPFITKEFSIDPFKYVGSCQRLSVIHIGRCQYKVQDLALVIDDKMKFAAKEPANATLSLGGNTL
jgi:hypothetical protein